MGLEATIGKLSIFCQFYIFTFNLLWFKKRSQGICFIISKRPEGPAKMVVPNYRSSPVQILLCSDFFTQGSSVQESSVINEP